jgi:homoprotocatechuate degradation regulator HpaR
MLHFRPNLREHGLTDQQWRVLRVLGEHGAQGADTGTVASEAYLLGPSLSGVLSRMESAGLVRRVRDAADARRTLVRATPKGRRLVQKLSDSIEAHYAVLEQTLGTTQLKTLYKLLDALIALEAPV